MTDDTDAEIRPLTEHQERRLEIISAILLGLATLLTAAAIYQAALLRSDANRDYEESQITRIEAGELFELAGQQDAVDTEVWAQLIVQDALGDAAAVQALRTEVLRPDALRAIDTWETLADRPASPFSPANPGYQNDEREKARAKGDASDAFFETARQSSSDADRATLSSVIFAAVLFVAGIGNTFQLYRPRLFILGVAVVLIVIGVVIMVFGV